MPGRIFTIFFFLFIHPLLVKSQDIHFSQFYNTPLIVTSANTGNFRGDLRLFSNYRSQWKQIDNRAYLTQSLGFDKSFKLHRKIFGIGGYMINDKSSGTLKVMKFMITAGFIKKINIHYINIGIQGGYVTKSVAPNEERFPSQYSEGKFDPGLSNQEANISSRTGYPDVGMGLRYGFKYHKFEPYINASIMHLNFPKESFFGNGERLKPGSLLNFGLKYHLNNHTGISPGILYIANNKANELSAGSNLYYTFDINDKDAYSVYCGIYFRDGLRRSADALITAAGIQNRRYNIGISYDYNISGLRVATNYRGGMEISLIYIFIKNRTFQSEIPCSRF